MKSVFLALALAVGISFFSEASAQSGRGRICPENVSKICQMCSNPSGIGGISSLLSSGGPSNPEEETCTDDAIALWTTDECNDECLYSDDESACKRCFAKNIGKRCVENGIPGLEDFPWKCLLSTTKCAYTCYGKYGKNLPKMIECTVKCAPKKCLVKGFCKAIGKLWKKAGEVCCKITNLCKAK